MWSLSSAPRCSVLSREERESIARQAEGLWRSRAWPDGPEDVLRELGFAVQERSLSAGWARVLARVDLNARTVCIDREAAASYAAEQGMAGAEAERMALAHELGHILLPQPSREAAEAAARTFAEYWRRPVC